MTSQVLLAQPSQAKSAASSTQSPNPSTHAKSNVDPDALWDGRQMMPFRAIDNPKMVTAAQASDFLGDEEYVLGLSINGESRAYPTRFASFHHAINDNIGNMTTGGTVAVAITYCSVCNTGLAFSSIVDDKTLMLDFYGLYNGVVTVFDRNTESVWLQVSGRAVKGPLTGKKLKTLPLLDTTWGQWKKLHPDTIVMSPDNPFQKFYRPKGVAEPRGYTRFPMPQFASTLTRNDERLPQFDKVLAVTLPLPAEDALRRAYPIKALEKANGIINDTLGDTPVVALLDLPTATAYAASRVLDGKTLTFEARKQPNGQFATYDKETGSRWNLVGKAEAGPLAGKSLTRVDNHLSQWYGWAAFFPDTTIFGQ
ncbi:MAG TPA: DUF3179 domain-containing protein [Abditibacteriaceae bacterium]|jgi:hypothetical protein